MKTLISSGRKNVFHSGVVDGNFGLAKDNPGIILAKSKINPELFWLKLITQAYSGPASKPKVTLRIFFQGGFLWPVRPERLYHDNLLFCLLVSYIKFD